MIKKKSYKNLYAVILIAIISCEFYNLSSETGAAKNNDGPESLASKTRYIAQCKDAGVLIPIEPIGIDKWEKKGVIDPTGRELCHPNQAAHVYLTALN